MVSKMTSAGVIRRNRPWAGSFRYNPYASRTVFGKEEMKEEVVRLGVELSVSLAESMFLLSDHVPTMLWFCFKLWKFTLPPSDPVSERLLRVVHHVYSNDIKPVKNKNNPDVVNSVQLGLVRIIWADFTDGFVILHRLVLALRGQDWADRLLSSAIAKYKQVLKKLKEKLTAEKHVSTWMNGFSRETIESNISYLWKSLFDDEEAGDGEVARSRIVNDLFQPILSDEYWQSETPTLAVFYPYILGKDFANKEMREEVMRLGVELSLYLAESMFLLCDDIRSMLCFCFKLWRDVKMDLTPSSPVVEKLLRVIHHVYSRHIKQKNGVYETGGKSAQWKLIRTSLEDFDAGIRDLHKLVLILQGQGSWEDCLEFMSSVEETLKKIEDKLRCAKDVSEANGFSRDAMVYRISVFWKYLFDQPAEEAWTLQVRRNDIISDVFKPLLKETAEKQH